MTQMASQIRSALRGGVSRVGGGGTSYHDGISYNAATGQVVLKVPGQAPQVVPFTTAFQYLRGSSATFRGPSGLIEFANENLITQSQTFDVGWSLQQTTISANATTAPDGTATADKILETAVSSAHFVGGFVTMEAGQTYTASVYMKAAERSRAVFYWGKSGSPFTRGGMDVDLSTGAFSNLDSGSPVSVTNRTVTPVGDGWYRISQTVLADTTSTDGYWEVRLHDGSGTSYLGVITSGLFVWGAQVQRGINLGSYLATVASPKYDQPRVEWESRTVGTNLLLRSQTLNTGATWPMGGWTVQADAAIAPDGTQTAEVFTENSSFGVHSIDQTIAIVAAQQYTFSVYAKSANRGILIKIRENTDSNGIVAAYNLQTGATLVVPGVYGSATGASGSITAVGGGWYRVQITGALNGGFTSAVLSLRGFAGGSEGYTGDGASQLTLWGAQFEMGGVVTQYAPTTATAPAFTNSPPVCLGLLGEWARTNLALQSQDFTTTWSPAAASISANATTAPDGTVTADKLIENGALAPHNLVQINITPLVAATVYTASIFVKADTRTKGRFIFIDSLQTDGVGIGFDLVAGTVTPTAVFGAGTLTASGIIPLANGWFRIWVSGAMNNAKTTGGLYINLRDAGGADSYTGDTTSGFFVWGGQLEAAEKPSSYIPTTTGSVVRSEDQASRTLGSEYVAGANTVVAKGRNSLGRDPTLQTYWYMFSGADNVFVGRAGASDVPRFNAFTGGSPQGPADSGTIVNGSPFKSASTWQASNDMAHSYNGGATATDVTASIVTMVTLQIGPTGSGQNGHLLTFDLYNVRIPNERLPLLSAL